MQVLVALVLLYICDLKASKLTLGNIVKAKADIARVGQLAAHFGVERGLVENNYALAALRYLGGKLVGIYKCEHGALIGGLVVAGELRGCGVKAEINTCPAEVAECFTSLSCADALLLHESVKLIGIERHALVLDHLKRQIHGETIGVIELECISAGEHSLALCLVLGKDGCKYLHTGIDGLCEVFLLALYNAGNVLLLLAKLGVLALVFMDNCIDYIIKEGLIHAEKLAVAGSTTQQAAQDIAPALV